MISARCAGGHGQTAVAVLTHSAEEPCQPWRGKKYRQTVIAAPTPIWCPTAGSVRWSVYHVGHHEGYRQHLL